MKNLPALIISSLLFFSCNKKDFSAHPANNLSVGASAHDLLSAQQYTAVKIEIQYMAGFAPTATTINNLTNFLNSVINKPGGIEVIQNEVAAASTTLNLQDIALIEKNNRTVYTSGNQLGLYFLFTNGGYTQSNVLGIAYQNTSMCLFGKTIHDNSGGIGQASRIKLESAVIEHEAGHILGLVDIGTAMQTNHIDPGHANHCNNSNCLMYYASETSDALGFLVTGNIPSLDANCLADLHANGGK
ncbi:MAG: hypothetical protein HY305_06925 [Sphingobacteriales bacterium]|nr:hypothetical protein [Sphingobacteriales bacterium]